MEILEKADFFNAVGVNNEWLKIDDGPFDPCRTRKLASGASYASHCHCPRQRQYQYRYR